MITDRRIFTTKITLYGISSFHFYRWNQLEVIPLVSILRTRNFPKCSATFGADKNTADYADMTQSQAANHHRLLSHVTLGLAECRK